VFWSTNQNLANPQTLNSYSYASNNPTNLKDPSGLATVKGSLNEILKSTVKLLKDYKSFLETANSNKGGTAKAVAKSTYSTAKNVITNPGGIAYDAAVTTRDSIQKFRNGSDSVQDQMIGKWVVGLGGLLLPKGFKKLPGETLVCRGGTCSIDSLTRGAEVVNDGKLFGVSVQVGVNGENSQQLLNSVKRFGQPGGVTTLADINSIGGNIVQQGKDPNHYVVNNVYASDLARLLNE
jgi:hypothetical protein